MLERHTYNNDDIAIDALQSRTLRGSNCAHDHTMAGQTLKHGKSYFSYMKIVYNTLNAGAVIADPY